MTTTTITILVLSSISIKTTIILASEYISRQIAEHEKATTGEEPTPTSPHKE